MKGKRGRPRIPFSGITNHKPDSSLTSADTATPAPEAVMARGGKAKTRLDKRARGGGIHIKPSHKGLLHKDTGTPEGERIPEKKLAKAEDSSDPAERKRAVFAANAKHWNHKK